MSTFWMYWIVKLDDIVTLFTLTSFLSLVFIVVAIIMYSSNHDCSYDDSELKTRKAVKIIKIMLIILSISILLCAFIPNTKQYCAIVVVPKMIESVQNNRELVDLPADIITLGKKWVHKMSIELDSIETK